MKYKDGNFLQVFKPAIEILNQHNSKISYSTRWLFVHLCYLEHKFTGIKENFFFRSIDDLHKDTGIGKRQIVEGIKGLSKIGLIKTWQMHWIDKETKKKSEKHITAFRIVN